MYNEKDKEKFQQIITQVEENGVSVNDVISFENLIGSNFISENLKINRFTTARTNVNSDYVIEQAREAIQLIDKNSTKYTILDVCKLIDSIHYKAKKLQGELERLNKNLNSPEYAEKVERLLNEKWCYKWDHDEVRDLSKDYGAMDAFRYNSGYLQGVTSNTYTVERVIRYIEDYIAETGDTRAEFSPLLLNIYNGSLGYIGSEGSRLPGKEFYASVHNFIALCKNYNTDHKESLDYFINILTNIKNDYANKSRIFDLYDYKAITTTYNNILNFEALLNDKLGRLMIDVFLDLLSKD